MGNFVRMYMYYIDDPLILIKFALTTVLNGLNVHYVVNITIW